MFKPLSTERFCRPRTEFSPGPPPILQWVEISKLLVDTEYQREIGHRGKANVHQIAENFDWSKFAPVIVATLEGGRYAIVDGQHRTTAAMLRGVREVPCQVVIADRAQQAAAYAAVNGNVTRTTAQQLYHARLAARDSESVALSEVCAAADVEITRRNLTLAKMKVGQTQAVGALRRCLALYGRDTLITALQCITQTGNGNPGFVRATIIEPLCVVLSENPHWRDAGESLLRVMDKFSFPDAWSEIAAGRDKIFPNTACKLMTDKVRKFLARRMNNSLIRQAA